MDFLLGDLVALNEHWLQNLGSATHTQDLCHKTVFEVIEVQQLVNYNDYVKLSVVVSALPTWTPGEKRLFRQSSLELICR